MKKNECAGLWGDQVETARFTDRPVMEAPVLMTKSFFSGTVKHGRANAGEALISKEIEGLRNSSSRCLRSATRLRPGQSSAQSLIRKSLRSLRLHCSGATPQSVRCRKREKVFMKRVVAFFVFISTAKGKEDPIARTALQGKSLRAPPAEAGAQNAVRERAKNGGRSRLKQ